MLQPAGVARVPTVEFIVPLFSRQVHFFCVDDDDVVTAVAVGAVGGFVFAFKEGGDGCGEAADGLGGGVDKVPCSLEGTAGEAHGIWWVLKVVLYGLLWWRCGAMHVLSTTLISHGDGCLESIFGFLFFRLLSPAVVVASRSLELENT